MTPAGTAAQADGGSATAPATPSAAVQSVGPVEGGAGPVEGGAGSPGQLQAVLFDLDGLLVDSEPLWTVAERAVIRDLGGRWAPELKERMLGHRMPAAVRIMLDWLGSDADPAVVAEQLLARMVDLATTRLTVRRGARELLLAVAAEGLPAAVVSSSYRVLVDAELAFLNCPAAVTTTVAGDEVEHAKPHPEPYLTAAARLGADPRRCVALEDSPTGLASAEAAGCRTVGVPDVVEIDPAPGRLVVAGLDRLSVADLRAMVS